MRTSYVPPSTMDGIKRLAKSFKRELLVTHHEALDLAARAGGYENLRHAQHQLGDGTRAGAGDNPIYLTAYWASPTGRGRETLVLRLPVALADLTTPTQLRHARNLAPFRIEFADHLERQVDTNSQKAAQDDLVAAARTLRFMAATGLRASSVRDRTRAARRVRNLPNRDHPSHWWDARAETWVYVDEPYHRDVAARAEWAEAEGVQLIETPWEGLHAPGLARVAIVCEDATYAQQLLTKLATLPPSVGVEPEAPWVGMSVDYGAFTSPARKAQGRYRKSRPQPAPAGVERDGAVPYGVKRGGMPSRWRPAVRMPLQQHLTVGPLVHALDNSDLPSAAKRAISEVRTTLDDWLMAEYPGEEMTSEQFHAAYYGTYRPPIDGTDAQIDAVRRVQQLLEAGYAPCAPRRAILKRLDQASATLHKALQKALPA